VNPDIGESPEGVELEPQDHQVAEALQNFRVVRNRLVRQTFALYPLLIVFVLILDALFFQGRLIVYDLVRLTGYIAVAVAAVLFVGLYDKVPETLRTIWDRGVIQSDSKNASIVENYTRFISELELALNNRAGWLLAGVPVVLYVLLYSGLVEISLGSLIRVALAVLNWFLLGVATWRLLVVGYMVSCIPFKFNIAVQSPHPDRAGGLLPLGELCFANALVIIAPTIFLAGWIIILSSPQALAARPDFEYFKGYLQSGLLYLGLAVLIVVGITAFFLPLYQIHREMIHQRVQYQKKLDNLTRQMDEFARTLLDQANSLDYATAQKQVDALKSLRQIYQDSDEFPVWPFNRNIALKLTLSQVIPLLSLAGVHPPPPIMDMLGNTLTVFQPK
jgi:hypothetical protein